MMTFRLTFITPLFSKGAYDDRPEVRAASIRGQLHWWHRALGGDAAMERALFGSVHAEFGVKRGEKAPARASRVVVRTGGLTVPAKAPPDAATLPHKSGGPASLKTCLQPGSAFDLHILTRLGGLTADQEKVLHHTLRAWLLFGSLGLRSTRAAGNFVWKTDAAGWTAPTDADSWKQAITDTLGAAPLRWALLDKTYDRAEDARRDASDTIGGRDDAEGEDTLSRINHPLGTINRGNRKTSPLRFRIVYLSGKFRIAALWDNRQQVTHNALGDLERVIALLQKGTRNSKPKEIGQQLARAFAG
jgi:hypothetical protein